MGMKCIGVDVGGTSVKIGLFEITGELLDKWEVKTRKEEGGTHILPDVARSIRAGWRKEAESQDGPCRYRAGSPRTGDAGWICGGMC